MATVEGHPSLTIVKNVCPLDCPDTCSMRVTVKDGVAIELRGDPDHRFTQGSCARKWLGFSSASTAPIACSSR